MLMTFPKLSSNRVARPSLGVRLEFEFMNCDRMKIYSMFGVCSKMCVCWMFPDFVTGNDMYFPLEELITYAEMSNTMCLRPSLGVRHRPDFARCAESVSFPGG